MAAGQRGRRVNIADALKEIRLRLKSLMGWSDSELEAFQLHLLTIGLLGQEFNIRQYTDSLAEYWQIKTALLNYPAQREPILHSQSLKEGSLGATRPRSKPSEAIIIEVRESLLYRPWPTYELVAYHELMHHVLEHKEEDSISEEEHIVQEDQARKWANWAILAGSEPELFSREATETIT